jgi:hypothetical protein
MGAMEALPELKQTAVRLRMSGIADRGVMKRVDEAIQQLESHAALPLPVSELPDASAKGLPLPASAPLAEPASLPRPSARGEA